MHGKREFACAALAWLLPALAWGVEFRSGKQVLIGADEVIAGDVYASGEKVIVEGIVEGDLVVAAREVTLDGRVDGDVMAAGQVVTLRGSVGDDVRMAGMALRLGSGATVAGHLVAAGYSFEAEPGSRVGGDVLFQGAKALLAGDVDSGLRVTAAGLKISGGVGGDVTAEVGDAAEGAAWMERFLPAPVSFPAVRGGLTLAETARIGGSLAYTAPGEGAVPEGTVGGGVEWTVRKAEANAPAGSGEKAEEEDTLASRAVAQLRRFAALLIFGLLLLWRAPHWAQARVERLAARPLRSFGWGVAGYVGVFVAGLAILGATILLAVLSGSLALGRLTALIVLLGILALAILVVGFLAAVLFGAPVLMSFAGGRALLVGGGIGSTSKPYLPFVLGLAIYVLVTSLPWVGRGLSLLAVLFGLGLLVQWLLGLRRTSVAGSA